MCGGYRVRVVRGRIVVYCRDCAPRSLARTAAVRLATRLRGVLGRFETPAPRAERLRLAGLLDRAAKRLS